MAAAGRDGRCLHSCRLKGTEKNCGSKMYQRWTLRTPRYQINVRIRPRSFLQRNHSNLLQYHKCGFAKKTKSPALRVLSVISRLKVTNGIGSSGHLERDTECAEWNL